MLLNFRQYSQQGPPVVILHGLYGNLGNWAGHARKLAATFSVYGFDARNHGQSAWADTMSLADMAADVAQTIASLDLPKVHLVGHSMGGKTAMLLALSQPDLVERLVVLDIAPVDYHKARDRVLSAMLKLPLQELQSRGDADQWLQSEIEEAGVRDFLLTNLVRGEDGAFRWRINLAVISEYFSAVTGWQEPEGVFSKPTLFIRGERSDYILPEYQAQTLRQFPKAQVKTVSGAGHWVHSEKPEAVLRLIHNFLLGE